MAQRWASGALHAILRAISRMHLCSQRWHQRLPCTVQAAGPDDPGGEGAQRGGPGQVWLHAGCVCEAGWMYRQILIRQWASQTGEPLLLDVLAVSLWPS